MNLNLSTKERYLLEDQKSHEQLCIDKYNSYANMTSCSQLKNLCKSIAQIEQQHLNTINQILNGQVPSMNSQQQGQQSQQQQGQQQMSSQQQMNFQSSQGSQQQMSSQSSNSQQFPKSDQEICSDLLMTEKYVSGLYNTSIFEFKNTQVRDALNHIQKEEQEHGDQIYKYMENKGMYSAK
ncbi:MAG: spore coat protein [Tissierellia bacterium]|nr:spore coat protein [Tissierellia bacterium]MDD4780692.1 spore coat protein [Tissierellia bacterium]